MTWIRSLVGALVLCGLASLAYSSRDQNVPFANLKDAHARLVQAGFRCASDNSFGRITTGFLVSREEMSWREVGCLPKAGNVGAAWKGKVWITVTSPLWQLQTVPDQVGVRDWGALVAFGDPDLLNEIDGTVE